MKIYEVKFMYQLDGWEDDNLCDDCLTASAESLEKALERVRQYVSDNYSCDDGYAYDEESDEEIELETSIRREVRKVEFTAAKLLVEPDVE